jgi:hypothetical protein
MPVTITAKGSDLKVDKGTEINYYPIDDIRQRAIGESVELILDGELIEQFKATEFVSPAGTAEQISDAISQLSTIGGGVITWGARVQVVATDVSTEIVPANPERKALIVTNEAGVNKDCWIGIGVIPVATQDMLLPNEATLEINSTNLTTQVVNAICKAHKSTTLTYQEAI